MLTLDSINAEIAEVIEHGTNREDVKHLAALYICRDRLTKTRTPIKSNTESEFSMCVNGRCFEEILPALEELMDTLKALHPRLYSAFLDRLR